MPENALYKVFESLLQDKQAPAFRSAAACCRTWRLASQEVLLDDTAASRPELPPMVVPEVEECKPTTATTCNAGLCDEAESETEVNGFEASSREQAKRRAGGAAAGGVERRAALGRPMRRAGRTGRGAGAVSGLVMAGAVGVEAGAAGGDGGGPADADEAEVEAGAFGAIAAAAVAAIAAPDAGDSEQVTPGFAQRRRAAGVPPPPPAPLRHAHDYPVFNTGAAPEVAAAAAAAIAAVDMQRRQLLLPSAPQQPTASADPAVAGPSDAGARAPGVCRVKSAYNGVGMAAEAAAGPSGPWGNPALGAMTGAAGGMHPAGNLAAAAGEDSAGLAARPRRRERRRRHEQGQDDGEEVEQQQQPHQHQHQQQQGHEEDDGSQDAGAEPDGLRTRSVRPRRRCSSGGGPSQGQPSGQHQREGHWRLAGGRSRSAAPPSDAPKRRLRRLRRSDTAEGPEGGQEPQPPLQPQQRLRRHQQPQQRRRRSADEGGRSQGQSHGGTGWQAEGELPEDAEQQQQQPQQQQQQQQQQPQLQHGEEGEEEVNPSQIMRRPSGGMLESLAGFLSAAFKRGKRAGAEHH